MVSNTTIKSAEEKIPGGGAKWSEFPALLWRGIGMGIAEVIPGVSGGTIALITNILHRFIEAIHSFDISALKLFFSLRFKEFFSRVHWRFFVMLFSGQILGILLCTKLIPLPRLFREYPEPMLGLFFGLILGSSILLARSGGKPGLRGIVSYAAGAVIGFSIVYGFSADTPETIWFMTLSGAIVICAWVLPGISGSFILLLLHKYDYVWEAATFSNGAGIVHNMLNVILPFGIGAVLGLMLFSRTLSWVMKKWPSYTLMSMTGLLISSLWAIFPYQNRVYETVASGKEKMIKTQPYWPSHETFMSPTGLLTIALALIGLTAVLWIDFLAKKRSAQRSAAFQGAGTTALPHGLKKVTQSIKD